MVWIYLELFCLLSLALILVSYPDWILSEDKMGRGISVFTLGRLVVIVG